VSQSACLVCLVSTVSGCHKSALGKGSASNVHITKLEQSTFLDIHGIVPTYNVHVVKSRYSMNGGKKASWPLSKGIKATDI